MANSFNNTLHIIFDKVYGYIRKYDGAKYLALFHSETNCGGLFYRVRCLII